MATKRLLLSLALLLSSLPCMAQVALVSHTAAIGNGTGSTTTTAPINTTGASLIVVCGSAYRSMTITDSQGNTWNVANSAGPGSSDSVSFTFYVLSPATSASHTFTATTYGGTAALAVMAFSGVAGGPDQQCNNMDWPDGNGDVGCSQSMMPTNNNELVTSCLVNANDGATASFISPMTSVDALQDCPVYWECSMGVSSGYQVQTTKTAVTPTLSASGSIGNSFAMTANTFFSDLSPAPLGVTTTSCPEAIVGTAYSCQLSASGGVAPYTWTKISGALPSGLSLSGSGLISGTPTVSGTSSGLMFQVTDSQPVNANSGNLSFIVAPNQLTITAPSNCPLATQYQSFGGCSFSASGGTPPLTFSWDPSVMINTFGLTINSVTGALGGTYYGPGGEYTISAQVTDAGGTVVSASLPFNANSSTAGGPTWPGNDASIWSHRLDTLPADTSPLGTINPDYAGAHLRFWTNVSGEYGGIPRITVPYNQPYVPVANSQYYSTAPIPLYAPQEGVFTPVAGNDNHVLVLVHGNGSQPAMEYDLYCNSQVPCWQPDGSWNPDGGTVQWNMSGSGTNWGVMPPFDQEDIDNLGGPMAATIWTVDEIIGNGSQANPTGAILHPQRLILNHTQHQMVWPATGTAGVGSCTCAGATGPCYGPDPDRQVLQQAPPASCTFDQGVGNWPIGEMVRLKSSFATPSCASGNPYATILFTAMREYGFILADQGLTGSATLDPDERWASIPQLASALSCVQSNVQLQNLEGVNVGVLMPAVTSWSLSSNRLSATTANPHNLQVGNQFRMIALDPGDQWLNTSLVGCYAATYAQPCTFTITSVPSPTTFVADITTAGITHPDVATNTDPLWVATYITGPSPTQTNSCDVNQDGLVNVVDVQLEVNMALGITPCTNPDGQCTAVQVQDVANAALGGMCVAP
jgi:hypothetical protein